MKLIINVVLLSTLFAVSFIMIVLFDSLLNDALEKKEAEGKCINSFIQLGIERKDIITDDGVCYLKDKS